MGVHKPPSRLHHPPGTLSSSSPSVAPLTLPRAHAVADRVAFVKLRKEPLRVPSSHALRHVTTRRLIIAVAALTPFFLESLWNVGTSASIAPRPLQPLDAPFTTACQEPDVCCTARQHDGHHAGTERTGRCKTSH